MKSKLLIIGAGGFGNEVAWLVDRLNAIEPVYDIIGFLDDNVPKESKVGNYKVVGNINDLAKYSEGICLAVAIGNAKMRKKVINRIDAIGHFQFPNFIDPCAIADENKMGKGNIVCANCICTVDYSLDDFCILNLACTVGHNSKFESFVTVYPKVSVSGNVEISNCVEIGTGTAIIQGISISENVIIGAGAAIIKNIEKPGVYVGVPAKKVK